MIRYLICEMEYLAQLYPFGRFLEIFDCLWTINLLKTLDIIFEVVSILKFNQTICLQQDKFEMDKVELRTYPKT